MARLHSWSDHCFTTGMSKLAVTLSLVSALFGCATPKSKLAYATSAFAAIGAASSANILCGGSGLFDSNPCKSNSSAEVLGIIAVALAGLGVVLDVQALDAPASAPTVPPTPLHSSGPPGAPACRPEQVQLQLVPAK
jgi:hypothetical protein